MRTLLLLVAAVVAVLVAQRISAWWYGSFRPFEAPEALEGDVVLLRTRMPGIVALAAGAAFLWIGGSQAPHGVAWPVWLGAGAVALRDGLRMLAVRGLITVGPTGVQLPTTDRVPWEQVEGVLLTDRNVIIVSRASRRCSWLRRAFLSFSSDVNGHPVWAMPQTQLLSTRDLAKLLGYLEVAGVAVLTSQGSDGLGFWRAIGRRLRP